LIQYFLLFAPPPGDGGGGSGLFGTLIMFAAIFLIFYFLIIRPQQKRQKERDKLLGELKKGDKVITGSGIHGTIIGIEEKTVLIQVSDNVKLKFERSAVATILSD